METKKERMQKTDVCSNTHCFQNDSWFRTVKQLNNYGNNNKKKKTMKKKKEKHLPVSFVYSNLKTDTNLFPSQLI